MPEHRVIVLDGDPAWRKAIAAILKRAGFLPVGEAGDGHSGLKLARSRQPDLVVTEAQLPGLDGLELARIVFEDRLAPVVVLSSQFQQEHIEKAKAARVFAFLSKEDLEQNLPPACELAIVNYREMVKLESQARELKETLEARKVIERAKGILMETLGLTESEAFKKIQRQSMNRRISMREVAEAIILAHSVAEEANKNE